MVMGEKERKVPRVSWRLDIGANELANQFVGIQ
jgi:hypothetical protein